MGHKTSPKRRRRPAIVWSPFMMQLAQISRGKNTLVLGVSPGEDHWLAIALEAPTSATTAAAVLSSHAHKDLGVFKNADAAQRACEGFAASWLRRKMPKEDCACEDIAGPKRRRKRG